MHTMLAIKATENNLSTIQNTCPNPAWFDDFMKMYNSNLEKGEATYFYTKTRKTGAGDRLFFYVMAGSKFNETFQFIDNESLRWMTPIAIK